MYPINTERRNVAFFVQRFKTMTEDVAQKEIDIISEKRIPLYLTTQGTQSGREIVNMPWHAEKNSKMAQIAFDHVFKSEPLPGDPMGDRKKMEQELQVLENKYEQIKLEERLEKAKEKIEKAKSKKENERKRATAKTA